MINTLRITSLITVILAGIFLVFPVLVGVHGNKEVEQLLNSPSVIETARSAKTDATMGSGEQISPLVKQAQIFALYLNPPQPKLESPTQQGGIPTPRGPITSQFSLIGTSFYEVQPELSMAFIDEPGKGLRWVRPSTQIGHLIIDQIKDGLIIVRDGQKTFEIAATKLPEKSVLLEGSLVAASPNSTSPNVNEAYSAISSKITSKAQMSDEEKEALENLVNTLKNLQKNTKFDKVDSDKIGSTDPETRPEETASVTEGFISDINAARVSSEEAEKLGDLGKDLNDLPPVSDETNIGDINKTEEEKVIKPAKAPKSNFPRKK